MLSFFQPSLFSSLGDCGALWPAKRKTERNFIRTLWPDHLFQQPSHKIIQAFHLRHYLPETVYTRG